ncbi:MAG TPA: sugar transferase [Opitutaceae bacterium]|jgi:lipopolysaccharide/colanic/teichoic acid biosynthesis glycosyltransferase|nr:sugar transferase [Opitutaceae bacterium]
MTTPPDQALQQQLLAHVASFQTSWGYWRQHARLRWQRLAWRRFLGGPAFAKRMLDVIGSACALLLLSPLFLLIMIAIRVEDGRPAIFVQTRVGRFGRLFKMYKFRSMHHDAEKRLKELLATNHHNHGVTFKIKDDPRITRVGKWLRKFSFDELPQFFNVLVGDMSLVGPRPPVPREVALYSLSDRRRLAVAPGITCIWQISGRAEIDFPGQVKLDVRYIETQSLWQDIKILLKTIPAVASGSGAY